MRQACGLLLIISIVSASRCAQDVPPSSSVGGTAQTLRVALEGDIQTLDPHITNEITTTSVLENIFESLMTLDENLKIQPGLATSWRSADGRTWRFHLRENARFHDGRAVTSEDVRFSYDRVLHMPGSAYKELVRSLREAVAVEPHTVELRLNEPYGVLANLGAIPIVPAEYVKEHGNDVLSRYPIGSGPYRFESWHPGHAIRLAAASTSWRPRPAFERLVMLAVPDPKERLDLLRRGLIDIAPRILPTPGAAASGYRIVERPSLSLHFLAFNLTTDCRPDPSVKVNPFCDPRVRGAFLLGIDAQGLVDHALGGTGSIATQFVVPGVLGYNPAIKRPAPDAGRARALLAESGYPAGLQATLDLSEARRPIGEYLASECARFGVRLGVNVLPREELYRKIYIERASHLFLIGMSCGSGDASELFEYGLHTATADGHLGSRNVTGYSNQRLDLLIRESLTSVDVPVRQEKLQRAMSLAIEDLPWLPLYIMVNVYGVSDRVDFTPRLDHHVHGIDVGSRR